MSRKGDQPAPGDEDRCYAPIGAERAYRAMMRRARKLPEGLRHAGALAELPNEPARSARGDYFREVLEFLRASAAITEERLKDER